MFECGLNKYIFWIGFIVGGFIFLGISEVITLALGTRKLAKEIKRKNDIEERKEPRL